MMLAWLAVVAPLVTDLGFVAVKAWTQLDNVQRAAAGATLPVGAPRGLCKLHGGRSTRALQTPRGGVADLFFILIWAQY